MAPREELVASAVSFLQDPSVSASPVEKRIEFLKSKNLTEEEVNLSLARAAGETAQPVTSTQNAPYYPPPANYPARGPPGQRYPYPYNPYGEWQPPPPPEPPRRDWRDWFIMATVVGGASYGLYTVAQRYIKPLIAPPTPAQLEQDKAAIDEQFNKAFALLDTLSSDTTALKEAEEARTQRLDTAITDIETIVAELKAANTRREDDARRMETEIKTMKDSLPRSIDSVRDASERQLKDLSTELGSLKALMGNRLGGGSSTFGAGAQGVPRTQPAAFPGSSTSTSNSTAATPSTENVPVSASANAPRPGIPSYTSSPSAVPTVASVSASRPTSTTPFASSANKAAIPAWQMAAANKAKDMNGPSPAAASYGSNVSVPSPSVSERRDGAEAVQALQAS